MEYVDESSCVSEPEPVIKEIMEYLARNVSSKIKLVKMFIEGEVQAEIFYRLLDSYSNMGNQIIKNRNDIIQRINFDLEAMDSAVKRAKTGLEELKIRKKIGDISEEEYCVKAPGYEWDLNQYDDKLSKKKYEKDFVETIESVMSAEDILELKQIGEKCLMDLGSLQGSGTLDAENAEKIKSVLEDALSYLK